MQSTTEPPALTAALVEAQLRAVIEAAETLQVIDDPGDHRPEFDFDPAHYVECGLYCTIDPSAPPGDGSMPLRRDLTRLIGDVRLMQQRRGINAGACKAFVPAEPRADDEARLYFKLGAFIFLARARPSPDRPATWGLGLLFNLDPDSVEDDL